MKASRIDVGQFIHLSEDEIQEFEQSRIWLAMRQIFIDAIQRNNEILMGMHTSGEVSRFLIGKNKVLEQNLDLPRLLGLDDRSRSTEENEQQVKQQLEKMDHG